MNWEMLLVQLIILILLLFLNAFFVSVEFATVSVPHPRIDGLATRGNKSAQLVQRLLQDSDRVLAASQVGITMASLGLGWLGDRLAEDLITPLVAPLPPPWNGAIVHSLGFAVAFIIITSLHIVIGEQAPKMTAIRYPDRVALTTARPIAMFDLFFRPFIALLDRATEAVLSLLHVEPIGAHKIVYTTDELKQILAESQRAGEIEPGENRLLQSVFEFADIAVLEVMVPRTDMIAVEGKLSVDEFLKLFARSSHERYPVYSGNLDNVIGYVSIKDVLFEFAQGRSARDKLISSFVRPPLFVPESKPISQLLGEMQSTNTHLVVVIDEYGGTSGMATAEDLLEEIVGGIGDERTAPAPKITRIDQNTMDIPAQLRIDQINEHLGIHLPESDDYETLAGLILAQFGRIPSEGESVQVGDYRLSVQARHGPRIAMVRVVRPNARPVTSVPDSRASGDGSTA